MDEKIVKDSQCLVNDLANDCISRQAAIDATWFEPSYTDPLNVLTEVRDRLKALPSAQPERKGKWIEMGTNKDGTHSIRCSKCGGGYKTRGHARSIATKAKYKFCPNCGADMRGEQDG